MSTLVVLIFVASNAAYLTYPGNNNVGFGNGGVGRSLLFASIFLVDGQGFILALIFGGEASANRNHRQYYERALGCFRRTVFDVDDAELIVPSFHGSGGTEVTTMHGINGDADDASGGRAQLRLRVVEGSLHRGFVALVRMMATDPLLVQTVRCFRRRIAHSGCFRGSDAVTWLVNSRRVATRAEGETLGMKMLAGGLLYHVDREHLFYDSDELYRFDTTALETHYRAQSEECTARSFSQPGFVPQRVSLPSRAALPCISAPLPRFPVNLARRNASIDK
jgi:hypothetical protein